MKKILAVYDSDEQYGKRLSEYLNRKESIPFSMVFFTKEEALAEYAREHTIDMLLLQEASMSKVIQELAIPRIAYLTEAQGYVTGPQDHFVYKFQSSDHVIRELMACYETMDMQVMQAIASLRPVKIIGIYSPVARCLKTSFALTLGQVLSKNQLVLYLNFEEFAGLDMMLGKTFHRDLSDAVFYFAQGHIKRHMGELVENWHNMDYIPPVQYPEDLSDIKPQTLAEMVKEIAAVCHYDVILLDFGSSMRFISDLFPHCQKIYMPVLEDPVSSGKVESFESWMAVKNQTEMLSKINRLKLPFHRGFGTGEMYLEQLLWGELGDYVRTLVKGEW